MKTLFENWRRYLKEEVRWSDEEKQKYLRTLGLHILKTSGEYEVYLYEWTPDKLGGGKPVIVGTLGTMEMDNKGDTPCIPETQEVGSVAVRKDRRGRGIGSHMYEVVAFYIKKEQNGGITSDHSSSTTNDAADVWKKLQGKLNYTKRKTPKGPDKETFNPETGEVTPAYKGGNDEFDYNKSTPDPNDDCYEPVEGVPPTDNSLQIPAERMQFVAELMEIQLDNFAKMMSDAENFEIQNVTGDGNKLFGLEYNPDASGIYQGEKK
tara:strand:- start:739 stop:1530 length:792 start_codon:yes stop_codon:yes gene_type:complete